MDNNSVFLYISLLITNFLASVTLFFPSPGIVTSFFSGNILNPVLVGLFAGTGSALGDFVGFLLGFGTRKIVNKLTKKDVLLGRFETWIKKNGFLGIFILSFIPNPIFDGAGLIAGALAVKPRDFLLATLLGRVLRNILLAIGGQKILQ